MIVLGGANLLADGFSMAARATSSARGRNASAASAPSVEEEIHIELVPEGEREEIRDLRRQGLRSARTWSRIVEVITSDRELWAQTMMSEELGSAPSVPNEYRAALVHVRRSSSRSAFSRSWSIVYDLIL